MEAFFAGLIGFLIGRGLCPRDAKAIVKALQEYLGFEPPLGLTGYALRDMEKNKEYNSAVVVRGKTYDAKALDVIKRYSPVCVIGKHGNYLLIASIATFLTIEKQFEFVTIKETYDEPVKEHVVCDYPGQKVTIQSLTLASNSYSSTIFIYPYDREGQKGKTIKVVKQDGTGLTFINPNTVNTHKSDLFEILVYDTANDYYKIGLKRAITFPNGVKITLKLYVSGKKASVQALIAI